MTKDQFDFQIEIQRRSIDEIDHQIYVSLLSRYKYIHKIAELKKEYGTMEMSESRQHEIMDKLK